MTDSTRAARVSIGGPFIIMLGLTTAITPLAMSIHVQSIPAIASDLGTSYGAAQLTVSLFLFTFAFVQIFVGPISDRFGRRPVLFVGMGIFAIGCLLAALAPTIEVMIAARLLQAAGGCVSLIVPRAVIQDRFSGLEAARVLGLVSMIQSSSPIMAPAVGGVIDTLFGWHAIFLFLAVYAVGIVAVSYVRLPETLPKEGGVAQSWATILSRYGRLLRNPRYLAYVFAFGMGTTGYFGFLASGPAVMIDGMGLAAWQFSLILCTIALQFPLSQYLGTWIVMRAGIDRVLLVGAIVQLVSVVAFAIAAQSPSVIGITFAMCIYAVSNGLIFANALAGAIGVDPRIAGSAASLLGSTQFIVGGITAAVAANLPSETFGAFPWVLGILGIGTFVSVLAAIAFSRAPR
jgi:DHA1 family bicyclomycin/chloramphenicol resistance-like MFS transporter